MYLGCRKNRAEFVEKIVVIDEILEHGRMKIGLQDTVCAVHMAERSDVQYLIAAASVSTRTRTFCNKRSFVTGKKKNLVLIVAKSPIKIVDPKNKSGATTSHIGVLAAAKKRLIELKKVEKVQGRVDSKWVQNYKKGLIKLGSTLLSVEGIDYYGWESLWYLASWMHINRLPDRKINLIIGQSVNGFSVKRINNSEFGGSKIIVSRSGASVYEFSTDSKGFVRKYSFVPFKQNLEIQSIETTTTRNNKRLLSEFASKYGLIEIKG